MATIKEVARRARVSVGTVSNVVSGAVPVSKRLKERVLEVIQQLDYQPDHVARSMKIRQTRTIGLVIPDITDPFFSVVMRGAEDAAWSANYILITFNSDDRPARERQALDALRSRRVDGILLVAAPGSDPERIRTINDGGIPIVCLDHEPADLRLDSVVVNNFRGAQGCVRHFVSLGHRRIGFLNGGQGLAVARDRYAGYLKALEEEDLRFDEDLVVSAGPTPAETLAGARLLLCRETRPTAVLAANIPAVTGLLRALHQLPLRCPEEVAVATFDDPMFSEAIMPALTAIAQPSYDLGRKGVELLLKRLEEPQRRRTTIVLETMLRVRESCGARRMGDAGLNSELAEQPVK